VKVRLRVITQKTERVNYVVFLSLVWVALKRTNFSVFEVAVSQLCGQWCSKWCLFACMQPCSPLASLMMPWGIRSQVGTSEFCAKKLQFLVAWFANSARHFCEFCATFQPVFSMVQLSVKPTGVLSRVSWLVGPLKLRTYT